MITVVSMSALILNMLVGAKFESHSGACTKIVIWERGGGGSEIEGNVVKK